MFTNYDVQSVHLSFLLLLFFFFNAPATPEIYTLSLHDALPIWRLEPRLAQRPALRLAQLSRASPVVAPRSEEHTSELQSLRHLVCRLLLEKKKTNKRHRLNCPLCKTCSLVSCTHSAITN